MLLREELKNLREVAWQAQWENLRGERGLVWAEQWPRRAGRFRSGELRFQLAAPFAV